MNKPQRFNIRDSRSRIQSIMVVIGLCLLTVLGRAFYLQVWNASYYEELARRQHERTLRLEPRRAPIYDRRGRLLAISVKVDSIHAVPKNIKAPQETARQLAPLLGVSEKKLSERLASKRSFTWVKRQIEPDTSAKVKALKLPGIHFIKEYRRYYPFGNFAGQLLGFTGIDLQGLEGLEYEYQNLLQSKKVSHLVEQDGTHRIIPSPDYENRKVSEHYALHLSIDSSIQYFAEKALTAGIRKTRAQQGMAIVMNSQTGAILGMANAPGFDPNNYQAYPRAYYLNRAVSSGYEPGSTLKLITTATALEENALQADQSFFCENGSFQIADQTIHDISSYGWLSLEQIIQKSSNICASKVGMLVPKETFYDYLQKFGFGGKTNIGLSAEATGKLAPPEEWTLVDHASISFGHGILTSPLQLVTAINAIAMDGMLVPPYIIERVENDAGDLLQEVETAGGKIVQRFGPKKRQRILSQTTTHQIKKFMIAVTQEGGSGSQAALEGYQVAGKTGTTEIFDKITQRYSKKENIASFVGFVPAENPALTILVVVESPKNSSYGGVVAAPIFREIASRSLIFLGILPKTAVVQSSE